VLLWAAAAIVLADLSVPAADARRYRDVVAVLAHPDDEVVCCGGTLRRLAGQGARVTLVILTEGERGSRTPRPDLRAVRAGEARASAAVLGVAELIQADLGDGQLAERAGEVSAYLLPTLDRLRPDLLITHDLAGLYGHADHITCAEVVTELRRTRFPRCALWYAALPRRVLGLSRRLGLYDDPHLAARRAVPNLRLFTGGGVVAKIRAWGAHRSQRASLGRAFPLWASLSLFEHFEEVSSPPTPPA
jgi:LmbE family N-acetylglucosaminyl deacetylase